MSIADKNLITTLKNRAKGFNCKIVLPEGLEPRVLEAAAIASKESLAKIVLLGKEDAIKKKADELSLSLDGIKIVDNENAGILDELVNSFYELRKHKGISLDDAREALLNPVFFAAMMIRQSRADGFIAGADYTTRHVARAAIQCLGVSKYSRTASSAFIMLAPHGEEGNFRLFVFADCGIVPDPTSSQLVDIAKSASGLLSDLFDETPKVAMLSYSTCGSGSGKSVDKVKEATEILKKQVPSLLVDGEVQSDVAVDVNVAKIKSPDGLIKGEANVLIFPNLDSGNIAYKLIQRLTNTVALGPLLLGLNFPASDLSRGCSVNDIVDIITITSLRRKCQKS